MMNLTHLPLLLMVHASSAALVAVPHEPPACRAVAIARATRLLTTHRALADIPGMQVAVWQHGDVLWSEGLGYADVEQRTPVTPFTRFRIASVSKALTAAGMMRLVQDGRLRLDAPVSQYVPSFPAKRWPITVRQLASGTSGIRHYRDAEEADNTAHFATVVEALALFSRDTLLFEPGTKFSYSSPGFVLLSAAMEAASGQRYLDFMQEHVFAPLGMTSTGADHPDSIVPFRSRHYVMGESDRLNAPFIDPSSKWASGGLLSTASDLARFGTALLRQQWLDSAHVATLFAPVTLRDGTAKPVAMGWDLGRDGAGRRVIAMDGNLPSARSLLLLYPDQGLVVAVLMNTGQSVFMNQAEARQIAEQFLVPECPPSTSSAAADPWTGEWRLMLRGFGEQDRTATLQLYRQEGDYRGMLAIDDPYFAKRPMPVPAVVPTPAGIQLTVLWGGTWMRVMLPRDSAGVGRWQMGPEQGEALRLGRRSWD